MQCDVVVYLYVHCTEDCSVDGEFPPGYVEAALLIYSLAFSAEQIFLSGLGLLVLALVVHA